MNDALPAKPPRAAAAARSPAGTRRGTIASVAGRWTAQLPAATAATRYTGHSRGAPSAALAVSATEQATSPA